MASAATRPETLHESVRTLLGDVVDHVRSLVRLELALARDEARRALVSLRKGATLMAAAALLGTLGLLALMAALVSALALVWPVWLAAGTVGLVFAVVGALLGRAALSGLRLEGVRPSATFETLEETKAWLKSRA